MSPISILQSVRFLPLGFITDKPNDVWNLELLGAQDIDILCDYFENISARGPDCSALSTLCDGAVTLGFHRLAIISLGERGNQPFRYGEGDRHSFVCSGEIYNWKEICEEIGIEHTDLRSDVDVIT